ncbi:hypothetical protein EXS65_01085 [Candidatus Peribacteria bacterium]|nr:hypothetical protein [Candidatus Peribacteria bacterium]
MNNEYHSEELLRAPISISSVIEALDIIEAQLPEQLPIGGDEGYLRFSRRNRVLVDFGRAFLSALRTKTGNGLKIETKTDFKDLESEIQLKLGESGVEQEDRKSVKKLLISLILSTKASSFISALDPEDRALSVMSEQEALDQVQEEDVRRVFSDRTIKLIPSALSDAAELVKNAGYVQENNSPSLMLLTDKIAYEIENLLRTD